jgi:PH domain
MVQESHRIQWQQWGKDPQSKRDLITRSATVRFTDGATAYDVVQLLGESLELIDSSNYGVLILVGILYNMPAVDFDHEDDQDGFHNLTNHLFHVIYTLKDEDNPMTIRDQMMVVLESKKKTMTQPKETNSSAISPKLKWYYIPGDPSSPILKYLELDGYATTMEEEDMDAYSNDDDKDNHQIIDFESDYIDPMDMPWIPRERGVSEICTNALKSDFQAMQQWQRWQQLQILKRRVAEPYVGYVMSGYLCKQSHKDPNVWRRVFCLVSEEYLWFVTRRKTQQMKTTSNEDNNDSNRDWLPVNGFCGRIALSQACLVSTVSSNESNASSTLPYVWEVISGNGTSHFFRAVSKPLHERWIQCIQGRILNCQENSLLHQAELIVTDESVARNKRLRQFMDVNHIKGELKVWALNVFDYHEHCRHIQNRLPAKTTIVAKSNSVVTSLDALMMTSEDDPSDKPPELDAILQGMIRAAWEKGASILHQAVTNLKHLKGRHIETICRHIDYVLTGRRRPSEVLGCVSLDELLDKSLTPPPSDLFDILLSELQKKSTNLDHFQE